MALNPRVIAEPDGDVRLEWDPELAGMGYRLYVDGAPVSRTFKPEASRATFRPPDASSHRYGLRLMDEVGTLEEVEWPSALPEPGEEYPHGLPTLRPGYVTREPPASATRVDVPAGIDGLVDCKGLIHGTTMEVFGGPGSVIRVVAARSKITKPIDGSPYWRGSLGLKGNATFYVDDLACWGPTMADGLKLNLGPDGRVVLQKARIESASQWLNGGSTSEPVEHCDGFQVQGPVKEILVGNVVIYAASVAASNDGGKCFQIDHEPKTGRALKHVGLKGVAMRGQGSRTGTFLGMFAVECQYDLEDVWAWKEGSGLYTWGSGNTGLFWPNGANAWRSSGQAPDRDADFDAAYINGGIREGVPSWEANLSRAAFGIS